MHQIVFFKLNLLKYYTKQVEMDFYQYLTIATNVSKFFCVALQISCERYSNYIAFVTCFPTRQKYMLITFHLVQSKWIKVH